MGFQSVPATMGVIKQPFANMGVMVNQGIDGTLEFNHSIGDFRYKLYGNFTYTHNEIKEMDENFDLYPSDNSFYI